MQIIKTALAGVSLVEITKHEDSRGFFARTWDPTIAKIHGLQEHFDYSCISMNHGVHTLRGMHYQDDPHGEVKLVRCTKGAIFDVVIDLRSDSPTFQQWFGVELTATNHRSLYISPGFAHGFLTLEPEAEVLYSIAGNLVKEAARGVRWNDPLFAIHWPASPTIITERDAQYPDFAV